MGQKVNCSSLFPAVHFFAPCHCRPAEVSGWQEEPKHPWQLQDAGGRMQPPVLPRSAPPTPEPLVAAGAPGSAGRAGRVVGVGLTVRIWGVGPEGVLTKALNLQLRIWICRPAFKVSPEQRGMASGLSLGSSSGGAGEVKQVKR